jgi:putative inorganic carbon (HCO3(-)) transporter
MRDIFLLIAIVVIGLSALRKPQIGLLGWLWISIMNPHRLSYGFIYSMPLLDGLAAVTIFSCIVHWKEKASAEFHPILKVLLVFYIWCTLTTLFSVNILLSYPDWVAFSKTLVLVFFLALFMNEKHWILAATGVFTISIAFFGVKGGLFTLRGGGGYRVYGPPGTDWGSNNGMAIAMLLAGPVFIGLTGTLRGGLFKLAGYGSTLLCLLTVLGTQSRGGLVGLLAMLGAVFLRSRRKVLALLFVPLLLAGGFLFMPQSWHDRMATIINYEAEGSANTRLIQWEYAIDISLERPLFGNGFDAFFHQPYYRKYVAYKDKNRAVHSSLFQVLGEQGYIGLAMYYSMLIMLIVCSKRYSLLCKDRKDLLWASSLIGVIQFSMIGFMFNGLTINVAYLDLMYYLLAVEVLLISHIRQEMGLEKGEAANIR